ncbi:sucrose-6-phosphate hydrolase [uncultured Tolumonas sp.]|uniref:sucrose-6-phosphate hydrolase n=1 Tax=uncultured Tolumonas sp. TaxID=263765 RepID=UPI00292D516C|nr:sucrose-6-phosphate hydrolase [uncultured Tolumonas sp.]
MSEVSLLKQLARSLMTGQLIAASDPYRLHWHLAPTVGLLNDPNGFIQAHDRYHLFYQWNPLACRHGAKWWGHWSSVDLVHWRHEPVALLPTEEYEISGCYSGSAVLNNDKITLLYTGNVKYADGSRTANQCLAEELPDGTYQKLGPVIPLPEGYTGHVRDPKVWQHDGLWYMVLAAQTPDIKGKVLFYRSSDLQQWQLISEIAGTHLNGLKEFGYMWECPDLFHLHGHDVLLCCPQGLAAEQYSYLNLYQCGYFVGELDYQQGTFPHGEFHELDLGFEFYAPQTTETSDGRRLMFGWLGMPDDNELAQPTVKHGWVDCMTCPRELFFRDGQLYQQPAEELQQLRQGSGATWQGNASEAPLFDGVSAELLLNVDGPFSLSLRDNASLNWDGECLTLTRLNWRTNETESRYWFGKLQSLQVLLDSSSLELFINNGEACMTARYFPDPTKKSLRFEGTGALSIHHWLLSACVIE